MPLKHWVELRQANPLDNDTIKYRNAQANTMLDSKSGIFIGTICVTYLYLSSSLSISTPSAHCLADAWVCSRFLGENNMHGRAVYHVKTNKLFMKNTTAKKAEIQVFGVFIKCTPGFWDAGN